MEFNYYYGNQADQFSFIRIPRVLLVDPLFSPLTIQSKLLYGVLLDRMGISMRNGWFDELNRVYIIYQISEIQEDLGFSKKKAIDYLTELETFGLVEKKRRGRGLPSILYIKSFMTSQAAMAVPKVTVGSEVRGAETDISVAAVQEIRSAETDTSAELRGSQIDTSRGSQIALQEVPESTLLEVPKSTPLMNNNNKNNTHVSYIESNHILSSEPADEMGCDAMDTQSSREMIQEQINYDDLLIANPHEGELVDSMVEIMLEIAANRSSSMLIASATYPTTMVQERFAKLDYEHIQYVIDCFNANTTRVGNIKKYLMTAMFNAPTTIGSYYTAAVHHDMPYLAAARIGG